jgi:hypothetical protein
MRFSFFMGKRSRQGDFEPGQTLPWRNYLGKQVEFLRRFY